MKNSNASLILSLFLCGVLTVPLAADELEQPASWKIPTAAEARLLFDQWAAEQTVSEEANAQISALWQSAGEAQGRELLGIVVDSIAVVEPDTEAVVKWARAGATTSPPQAVQDWMTPGPDAAAEGEAALPFDHAHLRLFVGCRLIQESLYDEAADILSGVDPLQVADPSSVWFCQAVIGHRLLQKKECLRAVDKLLENEAAIPRRYQTLAKLMAADLKPLEVDSLDEVARLMDDIRRRLDLGRAGTRVRKQEETVIAKLDKMIEGMEKQQQQQQGGAGQGSNRSNRPMDDSQAAGGSGPGDVDQKPIGFRSGWGNLPPKERQAALQQISKDLPAHYREVIEEYFRKLARDGGS